MSKQRMFNTKFWSDSWVVDKLNPLDRYLFIYLTTNEKTNIAGVYELPLRTMANELGLDKEEVTRMLRRLEPKVHYKDGWVVLVNAIKHQNYRNSKIKEGIRRELCSAPPQLLELVQLPEDADIDLSCPITPQDKSYMSHTRDIALNITKPNLIKSNSIEPNAAVAKAKQRPDNVPKEIIDGMLQTWEEQLGYPVGNETGNRKSIAALVRQHGNENLMKLLRMVKLSHDDQYAPRISDFTSLKRKQNDLMVWAKKKANSGSGVEVIS
jgi:hypothetical protein